MMKMKQACELTNLTERAVRLYLAKGLLTPKRTNGIIDFSSEDIRSLRNIAFLRHSGFTIAQISTMQTNPTAITSILNDRRQTALLTSEHERNIHDALVHIAATPMGDMRTFIDAFKAASLPSAEPNFVKLDETPLSNPHSRERPKHSLMRIILSTLLILLLIASAFLPCTRISGNISMPPFTIISIEKDSITIELHDEAIAHLLGSDHITVPYRAFGTQIQQGMSIENGCQLAVTLTNYDLLKLGVNPIHDFDTPSIDVNNAWRSWILQRMLAHPTTENCVTLWIREISGHSPLFQ